MPTEKSIEARTMITRLYCDCGGEMLPTGLALTSYPPQYPHRCQLCEKQTTRIDVYPRVEYAPVESVASLEAEVARQRARLDAMEGGGSDKPIAKAGFIVYYGGESAHGTVVT